MTAPPTVPSVCPDGDEQLPAEPGGQPSSASPHRPPHHASAPHRHVGLYLIERSFAERLDLDALDHEGIRLVNEELGVHWIYSFLSADLKKSYCLYEAPNAEAIREAAARVGMPADVIVAVEQFTPPTG
jgi:hypothetical protein